MFHTTRKALIHVFWLFITLWHWTNTKAQVAIGANTLEPHTILQLNSTTQGLLLPRLTEAQRNAIPAPADALIIYQTNNTPGLYWYHANGGWRRLEKGLAPVWLMQGNALSGGQFIGTTTAEEVRLICGNNLQARLLTSGNILMGSGVNNNSIALAKLNLIDGRGLLVRHSNTSLPSQQGEAPVTGAGIRMMWYGDKAAFRAGYVDGGQWNSFWTGNYSFAVGENTIASGEASFAGGNSSLAMSTSAVAMGNAVTASARAAVAMGNNTKAEGEGAVALGRDTEAKGLGSVAIGYGTLAKSMGEVAVGLFNTDYNASGTATRVLTDRIFSIGNGTGPSNRSNAWTVLKNGFIGIGVSNPTYRLDIPNLSGAAGIARAKSWDSYSDVRVKTKIKPLPYGIETLMQLNPVQYLHHNGEVIDDNELLGEGVASFGFLAQEIAQWIPEVVMKPDDGQNGLWSLEYDKLIPVLVNAWKQQQQRIEKNNFLIEKLETAIQKKKTTQ